MQIKLRRPKKGAQKLKNEQTTDDEKLLSIQERR